MKPSEVPKPQWAELYIPDPPYENLIFSFHAARNFGCPGVIPRARLAEVHNNIFTRCALVHSLAASTFHWRSRATTFTMGLCALAIHISIHWNNCILKPLTPKYAWRAALIHQLAVWNRGLSGDRTKQFFQKTTDRLKCVQTCNNNLRWQKMRDKLNRESY